MRDPEVPALARAFPPARDPAAPRDPADDLHFRPRPPADMPPWWHSREHRWAATATLLVHVLLVALLVRGDYRGDPPAAPMQVMYVLELAPPRVDVAPLPAQADPPVDPVPPRRAPPPSRIAVDQAEPAPASGTMQAVIVTDPPPPEPTPRRLELGLPDGVVSLPEAEAPAPQAWDRRPALEPDTTQFDASWAPDGSAGEDLAFRSKLAAVAMYMFMPIKPCSDEERRQRSPRCVPDQAPMEGPLGR